ncbi:MAG TPA: MerR family transcriptional regulator [Bryobacteraceae bacterium]|nr:MerR family transcriptional regulator [Bryobacteraceae bacterium]
MANHWIDEATFSFSELQKIAGIARGTAEGYIKRGILIPSAAETRGSGHHRRYSGRDVLKFSAVKYMSRAGVSPEWVKDFVASEIETNFRTHEKGKGTLDCVIDDYAIDGDQSAYAKRSPYVFNAVTFGMFDLGNPMQIFDYIEIMATGLRHSETVSYVVFDAWVFVRRGFETLQKHLNQRAQN